MPHNCRMHCPRGGHGGSNLRDALIFAVLFGAALKTVGYVAAPVSAGLNWLAMLAVVVVAAAVVTGLAWWGVTMLLSRRALARYRRLEEQTWAAPAPERTEPASLSPRSRELEAAPIRVEAFRVERERDAA